MDREKQNAVSNPVTLISRHPLGSLFDILANWPNGNPQVDHKQTINKKHRTTHPGSPVDYLEVKFHWIGAGITSIIIDI
jgi:hypothetical protein